VTAARIAIEAMRKAGERRGFSVFMA